MRPRAAVIDAWSRQSTDQQATDDSTQFVAKLGATAGGEGIIVMSRAHDVVIVPPPARPALAALALFDQPAGFTSTDVTELRRAAAWAAGLAQSGAAGDRADRATAAREAAAVLERVAGRIAAMLPPVAGE